MDVKFLIGFGALVSVSCVEAEVFVENSLWDGTEDIGASTDSIAKTGLYGSGSFEWGTDDKELERDDTENRHSSDGLDDTQTDSGLDQCPLDEHKIQPGLCGCGTPDTDRDQDGVPDCWDECPDDSEKIKRGDCGCGIAEGECVVACAEGKGGLDTGTHLCWKAKNAGKRMTRRDARDYCNRLVLGGVDTWRLPTRDEFVDILDDCDANVTSGQVGYCDACADSEKCAELFPKDERTYWTNTSSQDGRFWAIKFFDGNVKLNLPSSNRHVRCVSP